MELTLATFKEFLKPFFDSYELDISNVYSITVEPGGIDVVQYKLNSDGEKILLGDNPVMESAYYPYLGSE